MDTISSKLTPNTFRLCSPPPDNAHSNVPVLHTLSDMYKEWQVALTHIPRLSRYTLGAKIDLLFCETLESILLAAYSSRDQKLPHIQRASAKLDALKFFLQLTWELKFLDHKRYQAIATPLVSIGKVLGGWIASLRTKASEIPEASETLL